MLQIITQFMSVPRMSNNVPRTLLTKQKNVLKLALTNKHHGMTTKKQNILVGYPLTHLRWKTVSNRNFQFSTLVTQKNDIDATAAFQIITILF